jgi:hypothetical protein
MRKMVSFLSSSSSSCSSDLKSNGKRRLNNQQQHVLKWTLGMWQSLNDKSSIDIIETFYND